METTKEQPLTQENIVEQIAVQAKKKLIAKGFSEQEANKLAIEFTKERGEKVIQKLIHENNNSKKFTP